MENKEYRQGDVLLVEVSSMPEGAKQKDNVLALGEVTGHSHTIEGAEVYLKDGNQYVIVKQKQAVVNHQEHKQIQVPKGIYSVVIQREYDVLANRLVMD
jgi:hypothetical protein